MTVDAEVTGQIERGLLLLVGVHADDTDAELEWMVKKVANLRVFNDDDGKMNLSVLEKGGKVLVVSQFTLWGDCRKGRRPSFARAAEHEIANELYREFVYMLNKKGLYVAEGRFQEMMDVHLVNDGPVTMLLDSSKTF